LLSGVAEIRAVQTLDAAHVGTFEWDLTHNRFVFSNYQERLWGFEPGQFDGTYEAFSSCIYAPDLLRLKEEMERCQSTGEPLRVDLRIHGNTISLDCLGSMEGRCLRAVVFESKVSPQAVQERDLEIARLSRLYAALSEVNQAIVHARAREELFQQVCRALVEKGGFCMAWIGWHHPETQEIRPLAQCGDKDDYLQKIQIYGDDRPQGRGPTGLAFRQAQPQICNDILSESRSLPWHPQMEESGWRASAAFPIFQAGVAVGVLSVYAEQEGYFQGPEVALLAEAAKDLSFGLDNLRRQETLREERDFADAVFNSLPGLLYLYNEQRKFLRWNQSFETVSGYTAAEISTMHPLDFFAESDRALLAQRIEQVFREGAAEVEAGFRCKDGSLIPYHLTGIRTTIEGEVCLVGVGVDIAKRYRAEARYGTLFERAPDGIVIADSQSYYLEANPSICRMLGYTREELVGMHASQIVVPDELPEIEVALGTIKSKSDYHREWLFRRKDGSTVPAEVIATTMPDGNILGMIRDIRERKEAEHALLQLNATLEDKVSERTTQLQEALLQAEAADRIKSSFLANMSHELRTPLNSILGFTGILLQELAGPLTGEQAKQLNMVRSSARHLLALINDVLDLSKIEAEQLEVRQEPFELQACLDNVMATIHPLAQQKGLTLIKETCPALGQIVSDRRRVEQILINLLSNAVKFTPQGEVRLLASCTADEVVVSIRDTGMGIKPDDLKTLFVPFRQLDVGLARQHEGTGLGLAICNRLARKLGGEIRVVSQWEKGSEFSLSLPRANRRD